MASQMGNPHDHHLKALILANDGSSETERGSVSNEGKRNS
jgi:hypothetical protein